MNDDHPMSPGAQPAPALEGGERPPPGTRTMAVVRWALVGLRAGVIVLVVLAMLRPAVVYTKLKKQSATLVVLADKSRSMSVGDEANGKTRFQAMSDALEESAAALRELAADFELRAYTFDAEPHASQLGPKGHPAEPEDFRHADLVASGMLHGA